jgi:hypothetical protein
LSTPTTKPECKTTCIAVTGTPDSVKISEHWEVKGGLAQSIWVAYFEPQPLLDRLQIAHGLPTFGVGRDAALT